MIKANKFEVENFLSIYNKTIKNNKFNDISHNVSRNTNAKTQSEYFDTNPKNEITKTTKENQIKHNLVESEIYSLKNSSVNFYQNNHTNKIKCSFNDKARKALKKSSIACDTLLSENELLNVHGILNKMITMSRCKFETSNQKVCISNASKQTTCKKDSSKQLTDFLLSYNDQLILKVLEKMLDFGFPLEVIQDSLVKRKLDAVRGSFRLITQGLMT